MILYIVAVLSGLVVLILSSDRFIEGAASTARHLGMPTLLIGMVIVGFGTSAPELIVSTFSAISKNPGLALGNAFGSNIANIGFILGLTALISPITVHSNILKKELPLLSVVTIACALLLRDLTLSRLDSYLILGIFGVLVVWTIFQGFKTNKDTLADEIETGVPKPISIKRSILYLVIGLLFLVLSSRILVWGAAGIARYLGLSDILIGLTVVAMGTSLPELASSLVAVKKGEHDIAIGNVIGSNLFNTTAVVGIAGSIHPFSFEASVLNRDIPIMILLTLSLFIIGFRFKKNRKGRINRFEGLLLLLCYMLYTMYLMYTSFST
jgi:cation:H+ antiporter